MADIFEILYEKVTKWQTIRKQTLGHKAKKALKRKLFKKKHISDRELKRLSKISAKRTVKNTLAKSVFHKKFLDLTKDERAKIKEKMKDNVYRQLVKKLTTKKFSERKEKEVSKREKEKLKKEKELGEKLKTASKEFKSTKKAETKEKKEKQKEKDIKQKKIEKSKEKKKKQAEEDKTKKQKEKQKKEEKQKEYLKDLKKKDEDQF